jgi:hypothetical protein
LREPADDPVEEIFIALGDVVVKVIQEFLAATGSRCDGEAAPQVVVAVSTADGGELDVLLLTALGVIEPDLTYGPDGLTHTHLLV